MDSDYLTYFGRRSGQLLSGVPAALDLRFEHRGVGLARLIARGAVDAARRELSPDRLLRPDAEVLLYSLAYELVARPVLTVEPTAQPQLAEDIAADAASVVRSADAQLDGEVTGHAVVDGLSRSWEELRVANWRFWDRHR